MPLTDRDILDARPKAKLDKISDERGLRILAHPNGGKCRRFSYRHGNKQETLALGVYPNVSIDQASEMREEARDRLKGGKDPAEEWKGRRDGPSGLKFEFTETGASNIQSKAGHVLLSLVQANAPRAVLAAIPEKGDCPC